jgi:hypothetical protein
MNNVFEYPSVRRDLCEINTCAILPYEFLKTKELLISKKLPNKFYQVIEHRMDGVILAISENNEPISLKREDVYIVISYM